MAQSTRFTRGARLLSLSAILITASLASRPTPARACGGFFCSASQPVNQQAERIVFAANDDGTVTAIIEIQYTGPSERFAWVLPVEGAPEIGVSSNIVFQRLQRQTDPQYQLTRRVEGACRQEPPSAGGGPVPFDAGGVFLSPPVQDAAAPAEDAGRPPVRVVDSGSVGPYDWVAIMVDPEASSIGDVAVDWLQENGYDIDDSGRRTLTPYLMAGMNLVAFRLTKSGITGSIRPITVTFRTERPGIPILPTAVAAEDDMGVLVWVLGEHRAIPQNYLHLELNDALVNWFSPGSSYGLLVSEAADEAGGQGFVTELAGTTSTISLISDSERVNVTPDEYPDEQDLEFLFAVASAFQGWDGVREALGTVPLPADMTVDDFLSGAWWGAEDHSVPGLDRAAFLAAFHAEVIQPVQDAEALISAHRYVTRLYTTMSPAEMTRDPVFDFNADLSDVSNIHSAERVIECSSSVYEPDAPWRIELPSGAVVRGVGPTAGWPFSVGGSAALPATRRIERLETSGSPVVLDNNAVAIEQALERYNDALPPPREAGPEGDMGAAAAGRRGGCQASSPGASSAWLALLLGLVWRRRRS